MAQSTATPDRTTSGRFVRNLALSLSGGAILTVLGAATAHAQDGGAAGTASDGAGKAQSGDATAVGNRSGTQKNQTAGASGTVGNLQVVNQTATVGNVGVAVANTGGNVAIGNQSVNQAGVDQTAGSGLGPATNSGTAANTSDGSAHILTGDASAVGNESTTTIDQRSATHGQLGGILIVQQSGAVANAGVALANTGGNQATGNRSLNGAGLLQNAFAQAGLAANSGKATNTSDGRASIRTGSGSATGNQSDTSVLQSSNGSAGGDDPGLVLIGQTTFVLNAGAGVANTGLNVAVGNEADNLPGLILDVDGAFVTQTIGSDPGDLGDPIGVASNHGEASNWSDGTGAIRTGDAGAVGNQSETDVTQHVEAELPDGGLSIDTQLSPVLNLGLGVASTGDNDATGNRSDNHSAVTQTVSSAAGGDIGVVSNSAEATTTSDGTGAIVTGDAYSAGNRSRTDAEQHIVSNGGEVNLQTQAHLVANVGVGVANSGGNTAVGNQSITGAFLFGGGAEVFQTATLPADPGIDLIAVSQSGSASSTSDGTAAIETGTATAVGNDSETGIGQTIDPNGLVVNSQAAGVVNAGAGIANTGGNTAIGNASFSNATLTQEVFLADNPGPTTVVAGLLVGSNSGEASNTSDGLATIATGDAAATGNESATNLRQEANGAIDGDGAILNTQLAGVANIGVGLANSGLNQATGNSAGAEVAPDEALLTQAASIASENDMGVPVDLTVLGIATAANQGVASNASDGEANITTGRASAAGNRSQTVLAQSADGEVDGLGVVLNTQVGGVLNAGIGVANTGGNQAFGNLSLNAVDVGQVAQIASGNEDDVDLTVVGPVTASTSGTAENASDGTADIRTGVADATGNASATHLTQDAHGAVNGLGVLPNLQVAGVANVGLGVANSGLNLAVGNAADNLDTGITFDQAAAILGENEAAVDGFVVGPVTAAAQAEVGNASDGTAVVRTGGAQAQGNVSSTFLGQGLDNTVDGLGLVVNPQVGGVLNAGAGIANSGLNVASGNTSTNGIDFIQAARIGQANTAPIDFTAIGPVTASSAADIANTSDGTAKVKTGGALATGNASATNLSQHQTGTVDDMGVIVSPQVGGVANVGVGLANSGVNGAFGNDSENDIVASPAGGTLPEAYQLATIATLSATPYGGVYVGPVTAANEASLANTSDGEACVCTGDAVASGNVSSTTLIQDLDLRVGTGLLLVTETAGVLNAGVGIANTGLNAAFGNISSNEAQLSQDATINDALLGLPFVGPQTTHNGVTVENASDGTALVASGNASGSGNQSTTDLVQAASVDADFAVSALTSGTANAGIGLANAGLNLGVGNDSTNLAVLDQVADGAGLVSNTGQLRNESDGTAIIGNPEECLDEAVTPPDEDEDKPGAPGLPRTGAELQTQAAVALMLLLLGFGLTRRAKHLA